MPGWNVVTATKKPGKYYAEEKTRVAYDPEKRGDKKVVAVIGRRLKKVAEHGGQQQRVGKLVDYHCYLAFEKAHAADVRLFGDYRGRERHILFFYEV